MLFWWGFRVFLICCLLLVGLFLGWYVRVVGGVFGWDVENWMGNLMVKFVVVE